jgi:hypothetical protein
VIGLCLGIALQACPSRGQDLGDLSGSIDVSKVDAEVDGEAEDTLRQLYTLNYFRQMTNYIDFRAGLRYYDFDLDAAETLGSFQEELQPSAELSWSHPWFRLTASALRRISRSPAISGELISDTALLNWDSAWVDTPKFNLRYELQNVAETGESASRDIENQRLQAAVNWELEHETFDYRATRSWNENVIRGLASVEYSQRFQYFGAHTLGQRGNARVSSQYRFGRSDITTEVGTGQRFLEKVEAFQGLGGIDASPDRDPLPIVPGLVDGNTLAPVLPPLAIGVGQVDRNIGVDLGVRRDRVGALYVYTDRLSAATVRWTVWVSDDNLNWDDGAVISNQSRFNAVLSRYEIEFSEVSARFIKVVNSGINSIPDVQVTEIEAFESRPETGEVKEQRSSHLADLRLVWDVSREWQTSVDFFARLEPPSGSISQRLNYDYALRASYRPRYDLAHVFRWSQSWQELSGSGRDLRDDGAGYSLLYDPLPTLHGSASASFRQTFEAGLAQLRSVSGLLGVDATPWRAVRTSAEAGLSRIDQPLIGFVTDAWNTRLTVDTEITRSLRALMTWSHRESYVDPDNEHRVLRRLSFSGELQVTSSIFARASMTVSDGEAYARSEDYLLSWRLFSRLQITGQFNSDVGDTFNSERYSINGTLDLFDRLFGFRNVTIYVRFSEVDQGSGRGSHILSWQQGLRATF